MRVLKSTTTREIAWIIAAHGDNSQARLDGFQLSGELVAIGMARHDNVGEENGDLFAMFSPAGERFGARGGFDHPVALAG